MPAHRLEALAELSVAVQLRHLALFELRKDLLHPDQHAGEPHLREAAGALERDEHDLVDVGMPVLLRPSAEVTAADQPGLVVVGAEVGRAGMFASRYLAETIGATCSSVWNSMTRSTFSRTRMSALRCAIFGL